MWLSGAARRRDAGSLASGNPMELRIASNGSKTGARPLWIRFTIRDIAEASLNRLGEFRRGTQLSRALVSVKPNTGGQSQMGPPVRDRVRRMSGIGHDWYPRTSWDGDAPCGFRWSLVSVCRRQAHGSSATRRRMRRERMEMNAIAMKAMRWSFERSKMMFNRR